MLIATTLAGVALLGALALQGWALVHLRDQQARLDHRLDTLARRAAARTPMAPVPAARVPAPAAQPAGVPAPAFALPDLDGRQVMLGGLLASAKPLLLVFTDPRCGPCFELLPDLGGWARAYGDRLTIALVSGGDRETNQAMTAEYGIAPGAVLLQTGHEVAMAYGAEQAPAAFVVLPDGQLSGDPAYGAHAVRQLVAATLGLRLAPPPTQDVRAVKAGEPAPRFTRPDLDGNIVSLASSRTAATLLLFWSPGCHHCQELLPLMKGWEARADGVRLLVVSRGPAGLNREVGVRSSMVLDDDRSLAQAFGVTGTPAAVLIDASGIVASDVARGAAAARALLLHAGSPEHVAAD